MRKYGFGEIRDERVFFKIEKNVPLPSKTRYGRITNKYQFGPVKVGNSFVVDKSIASAVKTALVQFSHVTGRKFITRTRPEGVRIWRIE